MQRYESLRGKLQQPFVLLGFIVAALLSLITLALVANNEERAIARSLQVELESFRHRLAVNPSAQPANASLLRGYFLPSAEVPDLEILPADGKKPEIRIIDGNPYSVLASTVGERPFVLLYDRSGLRANLINIALMLLAATGLVTLCAYVIGSRMARTVVRPVVRLMDELMRSAEHPLDSGPLRLESPLGPADEIGRLVQALESYSARLYDFARRERYFASDVSHELRTPIAVIRGGVEVLSATPDLPEAVRERLHRIEQQAARMAQILDAMLILGREESADDDPSCSIADVLDEVVADCAPVLRGRPIELRQQQTAYPILPVERALVYVVVSNLVRNACNFTREGLIELRLDAQGIEVEDSGSGLPEDRFPELLERHVKSADSPGFGLGLSIVTRVCTRLRWRMRVVRSTEQGTTLRVDFSAD